MKLELNFTVEIPEAVAAVMGIDEDTVFESYYDGGRLHIRPVTDMSKYVCDGDCDHCPVESTDCDGCCENCPCNTICDETEEDE